MQGKTITATGIIADEYFAKAFAITSPSGYTYQVEPYDLDTVWLVNEKRYIKIPSDFKVHSELKVFTNYHLFGIKYIYSDPALMLQFLNTGVMNNCIMVIDEGYISADARRSQNALTIMQTWFAQSIRKRNIALYILVQHSRFIDWRWRYVARRKILTRYNEKTMMVRLLVQDLIKGTEKMISYWGPKYWKFYDTNELPPIPQAMIDKAKRSA